MCELRRQSAATSRGPTPQMRPAGVAPTTTALHAASSERALSCSALSSAWTPHKARKRARGSADHAAREKQRRSNPTRPSHQRYAVSGTRSCSQLGNQGAPKMLLTPGRRSRSHRCVAEGIHCAANNSIERCLALPGAARCCMVLYWCCMVLNCAAAAAAAAALASRGTFGHPRRLLSPTRVASSAANV